MTSFEYEAPRPLSDTDLITLTRAVERLQAAEAAVARLEDALVAEKRVLEEISGQEIPEIFAVLGMSEVKLSDGRQIAVKSTNSSSIAEVNRLRAFDWLRKNNLDSLIKREVKLTFGMGEDARAAALCENLMTAGYVVEQKELVPPSTLRAFVQERLESGLPLPDSITVFPIRKTIVKSSKGKI